MRYEFLTTTKINEYVTAISGVCGEKAYLFEGKDAAVLFDGLTGVGSLKELVKTLTDLPVTMVLSHAHPDHCGAAFEYGACYMHPDDIELLYIDAANGEDARFSFATTPVPYLKMAKPVITMEDMIYSRPIKTYPVYDGDTFELGGLTLTVVELPGHTRGSIMLLDQARGDLYAGDAINPSTLLHIAGATTVEEYKEGLLHLKERQNDFIRVYSGHSTQPMPNSVVDDALWVCDRILSGTDDAVPEISPLGNGLRACKVGVNYMPLYGGFANIVYNKDWIWGNKKPKVTQKGLFIKEV